MKIIDLQIDKSLKITCKRLSINSAYCSKMFASRFIQASYNQHYTYKDENHLHDIVLTTSICILFVQLLKKKKKQPVILNCRRT